MSPPLPTTMTTSLPPTSSPSWQLQTQSSHHDTPANPHAPPNCYNLSPKFHLPSAALHPRSLTCALRPPPALPLMKWREGQVGATGATGLRGGDVLREESIFGYILPRHCNINICFFLLLLRLLIAVTHIARGNSRRQKLLWAQDACTSAL